MKKITTLLLGTAMFASLLLPSYATGANITTEIPITQEEDNSSDFVLSTDAPRYDFSNITFDEQYSDYGLVKFYMDSEDYVSKTEPLEVIVNNVDTGDVYTIKFEANNYQCNFYLKEGEYQFQEIYSDNGIINNDNFNLTEEVFSAEKGEITEAFFSGTFVDENIMTSEQKEILSQSEDVDDIQTPQEKENDETKSMWNIAGETVLSFMKDNIFNVIILLLAGIALFYTKKNKKDKK